MFTFSCAYSGLNSVASDDGVINVWTWLFPQIASLSNNAKQTSHWEKEVGGLYKTDCICIALATTGKCRACFPKYRVNACSLIHWIKNNCCCYSNFPQTLFKRACGAKQIPIYFFCENTLIFRSYRIATGIGSSWLTVCLLAY